MLQWLAAKTASRNATTVRIGLAGSRPATPSRSAAAVVGLRAYLGAMHHGSRQACGRAAPPPLASHELHAAAVPELLTEADTSELPRRRREMDRRVWVHIAQIQAQRARIRHGPPCSPPAFQAQCSLNSMPAAAQHVSSRASRRSRPELGSFNRVRVTPAPRSHTLTAARRSGRRARPHLRLPAPSAPVPATTTTSSYRTTPHARIQVGSLRI